MRKFMKSKKGFTLVELLIVVVILGILAAVAIPRFVTTQASSQQEACRSNIAALQSVYEELSFNGLAAPAAASRVDAITTLVARFPQGMPECPGGGVYKFDATVSGKITCDKAGHAI